MTIAEAMADLSIQLEVKRRLGKDHEADALKLGIKALEYIKYLDSCPGLNTRLLLPGETEE